MLTSVATDTTSLIRPVYIPTYALPPYWMIMPLALFYKFITYRTYVAHRFLLHRSRAISPLPATVLWQAIPYHGIYLGNLLRFFFSSETGSGSLSIQSNLCKIGRTLLQRHDYCISNIRRTTQPVLDSLLIFYLNATYTDTPFRAC